MECLNGNQYELGLAVGSYMKSLQSLWNFFLIFLFMYVLFLKAAT